MIREAEEFKEQDNQEKERIEAKNNLENSLFQMKSGINKLEEEDKNEAEDKISTIQSWIDDNLNATKEEYLEKSKELHDFIGPLLQKQQSEPIVEEPKVEEPKVEEPDDRPDIADVD